MVSFTPMGRMGNFLFEAATAFAYAKKHDLEFSVPLYTNSDFHCPIYLKHLQHPNYYPNHPTVRVTEYQHQYQELPFEEGWRNNMNVLLVGYWQTEKYFKEYRESILKAFNYRWIPAIGTVSIHVRRGDYVTFREKHPEVTDEFYYNAIAYFTSRGFERFKVFSDDIPYCKGYFDSRFMGAQFEFSEGQTIEEDMRLGSCCNHHINSSSTFSWWLAWLNRNPGKVVITPKKWFGDNWGGLDTSDIIPESWIKM